MRKAQILTLDFIENKPLNYDIKLEGCSVYSLTLDSFKESLRLIKRYFQFIAN